jgi:HD-GYP domain-containing protein (c-di-GMP phosphodiesterase class II)
MTTTRPYRKALRIEEAIRRLEDAAGTQLDERLVATFTAGILTELENLPTPVDEPAPELWVPSGRVA